MELFLVKLLSYALFGVIAALFVYITALAVFLNKKMELLNYYGEVAYEDSKKFKSTSTESKELNSSKTNENYNKAIKNIL